MVIGYLTYMCRLGIGPTERPFPASAPKHYGKLTDNNYRLGLGTFCSY